MKLDKRYAPELITDPVGGAISNCFLDLADVETPCLVSTNGHVLVAVPVIKDADDLQGIIPTDALVAAKKIADKKVSVIHLRTNPQVEIEEALALFERPKAQFPDWRAAMPVLKDTTKVSVSFDPFKLLALAQAMGADKKNQITEVITLTFNPNEQGFTAKDNAIQVQLDSSDARGVLMPCRSREAR